MPILRSRSFKNRFQMKFVECQFLSSYGFILVAVIGMALSRPVRAQSDPSNFAHVINLPQDQASLGDFIEPDTQVNLYDGGLLDFSSNQSVLIRAGMEVNMFGGEFAETLGVFEGGAANISGGLLPRGMFVRQSSTVKVSGGSLYSLNAAGASLLNISGGTIGFFESSNATVDISGGQFQRGFYVRNNTGDPVGSINISGGKFGTEMRVFEDADINLFGGEFQLNNLAVDTSVNVDGINKNVFTGTLADGSVFIFRGSDEEFISRANLNVRELAPASLTPIDVDSSVVGLQGLRQGQTLNLKVGGNLSDNFRAVGATVNIQGGSIGEDFRTAYSTVNLSSGNIGWYGTALAGSVYNISGGTVDENFTAERGSQINLTGGTLNRDFVLHEGSQLNIDDGIVTLVRSLGGEINIRGGQIGNFDIEQGVLNFDAPTTANSLTALHSGIINVSNGTVKNMSASSGGEINITNDLAIVDSIFIGNEGKANITGGHIGAFRTSGEGKLNISGGKFDFLQDFGIDRFDATISGGDFMINGVAAGATVSATVENGNLFTGTLADGNIMIFKPRSGSSIYSANLNTVDLAPADTSPIVVNQPASAIKDLRPGQTLNVQSEGSIDRTLSAIQSDINIQGGLVNGLRTAYANVNMIGGTVGRIDSYGVGSKINISGGNVRDFLYAEDTEINIGSLAAPGAPVNSSGLISNLRVENGSVVNLDGGTITTMRVRRNGTFNMNGGWVGNFSGDNGSVIKLAGGTVLTGVSISGEAEITGGVVRGSVNLGQGAQVNMSGGRIGNNFYATQANFNMSGGTIGDDFAIYGGNSVAISGGTIGQRAVVGTKATISGGTFGSSFKADRLANLDISGGLFGRGFDAIAGSVVNISGGKFGDAFKTRLGSQVTLVGNDFIQGGNLFAGTLADGSSFIFSPAKGDLLASLKIELVDLPAVDSTPILIDAGTIQLPNSLRNGQTMTVQAGGVLSSAIVGNPFTNVGGILNIDGGHAPDIESAGGVVNVTAGSVGELNNYIGSVLNVSGGTFRDRVSLFDDSVGNFSGGKFSGGLDALDGSITNLLGSNFKLNGQEIENLIANSPFDILQRDGSVLSGKYASGDSFSFAVSNTFVGGYRFGSNANLTITQVVSAVPEPSALLLLGLSGLVVAGKRRRMPK